MSGLSDGDRSMAWDPAAEGMLRALVDMVPENMRELAIATARDESELAAQDRHEETVGPSDVIRGWIRTTPPEQRDGLVEVIDALGFDPQLFEADLSSAEGWEEGDEE